MKKIQLSVQDHSPKMDRKELSVLKTLIPLWFRGADMKLAQASIKLSTKLNKLTQTIFSVKRSFVFDFNSAKTEEANEYTLATHFFAEDSNYNLVAGYFAEGEVGDEIMPIDGLIAQIGDIARIDPEAVNHTLLGVTMGDIHKEIIETLTHVNGHCSLTHAEVSESTVVFKLKARNNHGRVFVFRLMQIESMRNGQDVEEQLL